MPSRQHHATNRLMIRNRDARRLWLTANLLDGQMSDAVDVMAIIRRLGFLQIDTVRNITRAHDHILWSRSQRYREGMVWQHLRQRDLFEHFTHDASLIPMDFFPIWQCQFDRLGEKTAKASWYRSGMTDEAIATIRRRIAAEGPLSTRAFDGGSRTGEMWSKPPHKKALEQMWYGGVLATSHRENFEKFYDLGERVFPSLDEKPSQESQRDDLCRAAIDRLWVASASEIRRFWDAVSVAKVADWLGSHDLVPARVEDAAGNWHDSWALPDIETRLASLPDLTTRMRLINPFDPAVRDRKRLFRLFGFEYRNEMFVPAANRQWGYYVYPLLEADQFVGRIELKADRPLGLMRVSGFWPEPTVSGGRPLSWGKGRMSRLSAELQRFARYAGLRLSPAGAYAPADA